jgi:hypothetical protein
MGWKICSPRFQFRNSSWVFVNCPAATFGDRLSVTVTDRPLSCLQKCHFRHRNSVYGNRRLKPLYALVDKKPEHFPSGVYYLRYTAEGKPAGR